MYEALNILFSQFLTTEVILTSIILFILGFFLKKIKKLNNNHIPTLLILFGLITNGFLSLYEITSLYEGNFSLSFIIEIIKYIFIYSLCRGFISMAFSVAIHQLLKQNGFFNFIKKLKNKNSNINDNNTEVINQEINHGDNISELKNKLNNQ